METSSLTRVPSTQKEAALPVEAPGFHFEPWCWGFPELPAVDLAQGPVRGVVWKAVSLTPP